MRKFPQNTIWRQDNNSDLYGDIWASFGINISAELGKLKTNRTLSVARSVDDGTDNYVNGLGVAAAFRYYNGQYWAATTGTISKCGTSRTGAWGLDTTSGKPTTLSNRYSDLDVFNEILYASPSSESKIYKLNDSTWSFVNWANMVTSRPHSLCAYSDRVYCQIDYAKIESINSSDSIATVGNSYAINLTNPTSNTITFMLAGSLNGTPGIWIGTVNRTGGKAYVYFWDGQQTSVNYKFLLESSGAMAGVVKDDTLYVMDNDGRLLAFNGGTFVEIDKLPIKDGDYLKSPLLEYNERWIHPRGMTVKDGAILLLINNEYRGATATFEENLSSGIWEWTKETGLYCKYPLSLTNHDATTLRDYGQSRISLAGALSYFKSSSTSATDNGALLASAQLYYDSSNTENHILIDDLNDTYQKFAYFITPKIFSTEIDDVWQTLLIRLKKLTTGDEISMRYRTSESTPLDILITTWSGSNKVRTSTSISDYDAGDEIEFTQGEGSGKCFKILSKSDLGGGVTEITLDGEFTGIDSSGYARLQHWKDISEPFSNTSIDVIKKTLLSVKNSAWVQFKICIQNTGDSYIYDMTIVNKVNQKI